MKKTWDAPKLVILSRSRPEESVLTACKYGIVFTDSNEYFYACFTPPPNTCLQCEAYSES